MGQHKDAASFTAVTQNLRGLTTKKLEIIIKNMEDKAVDITVLQETWKVTPTGVAIEAGARQSAIGKHEIHNRLTRFSSSHLISYFYHRAPLRCGATRACHQRPAQGGGARSPEA